MAEYKLWGVPKGHKNTMKAQLAAKYAGVQITMPPMEFGKTNKSPEYLAKNPNGKVCDCRHCLNNHVPFISAPHRL